MVKMKCLVGFENRSIDYRKEDEDRGVTLDADAIENNGNACLGSFSESKSQLRCTYIK